MISRHVLLDALPERPRIYGAANAVVRLNYRDADERTVARWLAGGMVGKLVRTSPLAPITVRACPDTENGAWGVEVQS